MTTHDQDTYTQPAESTSRTEQPLPSETPHRQVQSDWSDGQGLSPDQAQAVPTQTQATVRDSAVVSSEPAEQSVRKPIESSTERELFADDELAGLRARWDTVQATFVDDPRDCVQKADGLVSDVVQQLTAGFSDARARLEEQWARDEEASTEDLRVALKQYREFFQRLLAV
jgi:hypothetical protein